MTTGAKVVPVLRVLLENSKGRYFNVQRLSDATGVPVRSLCSTLGGLSQLGVVEYARPGRGSSRLAKDRWYRFTPEGREKAREILGIPGRSDTPAVTARRTG